MIKPRIVFKAEKDKVLEIPVQMNNWYGGFALSQAQKNVNELHNCFLKMYPDLKILEVSSKSTDELGIKLSAFNLKKYVPSLNKSVPVECVFQAGKVFENGGPYLDLLEALPKDAKRDERLRNSGKLIAFEFEGKRYPTYPLTEFYDSIYIEALNENKELAKQVIKYDAFTDIAFNKEKSINCQARTCAKFKTMHNN